MSTHRTFDGRWAACEEGEACALLFHVELSVEQAAAMPERAVIDIFTVIDPPTYVDEDDLEWFAPNGDAHRDYDLPARIRKDGACFWYQNSELHRDGDKPAIIHADGTLAWFQHGRENRANGLPTRISADGTQLWIYDRRRHRLGGPAVIHPNGQVEYWEYGALMTDDSADA